MMGKEEERTKSLCSQDIFDELQSPKILWSVREAILNFHENTCATVPYASYVVDYFLEKIEISQASESSDSGDFFFRVHVIECNPFGGDLSSGSCLFDWEADRNLLYGHPEGDLPSLPVLRVRKKTSDPKEYVFLETSYPVTLSGFKFDVY
jgi:hypothetical protein